MESCYKNYKKDDKKIKKNANSIMNRKTKKYKYKNKNENYFYIRGG